MNQISEKTISRPTSGFKVFQTPEGHYGIKYSFLGCGGTLFIVFILTFLTIWTFACVTGTWKALFEKSQIDYSMLIFMLPFWCAEIIVAAFVFFIRPFTKIIFYPDYLLLSKSFFLIKTEKMFSKASVLRINQLRGEDNSHKLILEAEKSVELLSGRSTDECKWLAEILSEWSGKECVRDTPLLEKIDRKMPPKGFKLEMNIDGESVINCKSYGTVAIKVFMIMILAYWGSFCVVDYCGWFDHDGDVLLKCMLWVSMIILIIICTNIFSASLHIRLGFDTLFIKEKVFGISWRKEIPKSSIKFLEQVKDGGGDEDSFPSWGLFVHWDKKTKILSRQKYENSQWLGTVISKWANVEYKASEERVYEQL